MENNDKRIDGINDLIGRMGEDLSFLVYLTYYNDSLIKFNNRSAVKDDGNSIDLKEKIAIGRFYKEVPDGFEVDHIVALCRGGTHVLKNLQYLSKSENRKKQDMDNEEYESRKRLIQYSKENQ
jgi:hypothetical protein